MCDKSVLYIRCVIEVNLIIDVGNSGGINKLVKIFKRRMMKTNEGDILLIKNVLCDWCKKAVLVHYVHLGIISKMYVLENDLDNYDACPDLDVLMDRSIFLMEKLIKRVLARKEVNINFNVLSWYYTSKVLYIT